MFKYKQNYLNALCKTKLTTKMLKGTTDKDLGSIPPFF